MSKELRDITGLVMNKIDNHEIKMRPKIYFVIGSALTFLGLVASMLVSVFLVGLIRFFTRAHGPMGEYRLDQMLSNFPWWAVVFAIFGLIFGIKLLRRYDFSYKLNFKAIVIGFVMAVIVAGWVIDMTGLNDILFSQGPKRGIMRRSLQEDGVFRQGWNRQTNSLR